jgi:hypothetical protein
VCTPSPSLSLTIQRVKNKQSRGAISADIFVPTVWRPSGTCEPPQKETNQTGDKQPTPSDMSDDDGLLRAARAGGRFTLGTRFIRHALLSVIEVGIVPGLIRLRSVFLGRGCLGMIAM